ncbi:nuclear transport factor 2 family protein [Reichenbachiella sp.]|uniref:nuclear transport factor 2 family protein n=1 Tax=Reichenbachiella sp. TaxID=2184521 RepID=UPI003BAF2572
MKKIAYLIYLFSLLSCTVEVSTESDIESLNQAINDFNLAFEKVDIAKLNLLTTDQYAHVNGSNPVITKEAWMAYLKKRKGQLGSGTLEVTKYQFKDKQLVQYDQSAYVTGIIEMDGNLNGEEFSRRIRVSHFWVQEDGQWKRAGFHDVRIGE